MLFVSISFALGSQRKRGFQWNMGFNLFAACVDTGACIGDHFLSPIPTRRFTATPIVLLIGRLLVWDTRMYMFDLNRRPILWMIGHRFRSNLYIPVSHTNRRPFKNTIGVVKNHLVGMGLYPRQGLASCLIPLVNLGSLLSFNSVCQWV